MAEKPFSSERVSDQYILLNNCGIERFFDTDAACIRRRGRADYLILYIAEGCCDLHLDGTDRSVGAGNVILFRPGEKQHYSYDHRKKPVSYYMHFTGVGCPSLLEKLGISDTVTHVDKSAHFESVFHIMLREYTLKQYAYEQLCGGLLLELLSILSRAACITHSKAGKGHEELIMRAEREIYENLQSVSIDALAASCYLSKSRFSHIFKEVTGKSPLEYVMQMRLQRAKDMLLHTGLPIGRIAREAGYDDQNYFSRLFRRETGMTPSEFRK